MDGFSFDVLTRTLTTAGSRRRALVLALSGALAPLLAPEESDAHDALLKCKKKSGKQKKKCVKKAKAHNATHTAAPCVGSCTGKECGGDGCGRVCGICTAPRTSCVNGRCGCPEDECQGNCIVSCEQGEARNPGTCTCCIAGGDRCNTAAAATPCCLGPGACVDFGGPSTICLGLGEGQRCAFDEQCSSRKCEPVQDGDFFVDKCVA